MWGAKTKALCKDKDFLLAEIDSVIQQAQVEWSQLCREMTDDRIAHVQANTTTSSSCTSPLASPMGKLMKKPSGARKPTSGCDSQPP